MAGVAMELILNQVVNRVGGRPDFIVRFLGPGAEVINQKINAGRKCLVFGAVTNIASPRQELEVIGEQEVQAF